MHTFIPSHNEDIQAYGKFKIVKDLLKTENDNSEIQVEWIGTNNNLDVEGAALKISHRINTLSAQIVDTETRVNEEILELVRHEQSQKLLIADIGWTREEAQETRARLASFEEDWNAPGMELYDAL